MTPGRTTGSSLTIRDRAAETVARGAAALLRRTGAGAGRSLPGLVVERLAPGYLGRKVRALPDGVVAVSGTNGKTTTASMLRAILRHDGIETVGNESGANLSRGVVSAMVDAPPASRVGVFEVDEAHLANLAATLAPRVLVATNVFRDQLDRFAEPEMVARLLRSAAEDLPAGARVVANADDPLLWSRLEDVEPRPLAFGVEPIPGAGRGGAEAEPEACPRCGGPAAYEGRTIAHLGRIRCDGCGWRSTPPAVLARIRAARGVGGIDLEIGGHPVALPLGGVHNAYNAAAAVAGAVALGLDLDRAVEGLAAFRPRFGRAEELSVGGRPVWILLMKNPAGAGVLIDEVAADPRVGAAVIAVSDQLADGRDVSWIWDADFERLAAAGLPLVPGGRRAADVGVRLKYAGATPLAAEHDPGTALRAALAAAPAGRGVAVLATYTAMLDLRRGLMRNRRERLSDRPASPRPGAGG